MTGEGRIGEIYEEKYWMRWKMMQGGRRKTWRGFILIGKNVWESRVMELEVDKMISVISFQF